MMRMRMFAPVFVSFILILTISYIAPARCDYSVQTSNPMGAARDFVENIAGINLSQYGIYDPISESESYSTAPTHTQSMTRFTVENALVTARIRFELIDGKFSWYMLNVDKGSMGVANCSFGDMIQVATRAIQTYTRMFNASYCGGFDAMLSEAVQAGKRHYEKGNMLLTIEERNGTRTSNAETDVMWYEKIWNNPNITSRQVSLTVDNKGIVNCVMDTMPFCRVAGEVKISEEQAVNIALPAMEKYAAELGARVIGVGPTFFGPCTRPEHFNETDGFLISPMWGTGASLEMLNNTLLRTGVCVWVCADCGEILVVGQSGTRTAEPTTDQRTPYVWLLFGTIPLTLVSVGIVTYSRQARKKRR